MKITFDPGKILFDSRAGYRVFEIENQYIIFLLSTPHYLITNRFGYNIFKNSVKGKTIGQILSAWAILGSLEKKTVKSLLLQLHFFDEKSSEAIKNRKFIFSNTIWLFLTNGCNLRCIHCFMNSGRKTANELKLNDWKKVLVDFKQLCHSIPAKEKSSDKPQVTFAGGESTVLNYFPEIVKFAKRIGFYNRLVTNGVNTEALRKALPYIDSIEISLYGVSNEMYERISGARVFKNVLDSISLAEASSVKKIVIAIPMMPVVIEEYFRSFEKILYKLAIDKKRTEICLHPTRLDGRNTSLDNYIIFPQGSKYSNLIESFVERLNKKEYKCTFGLMVGNGAGNCAIGTFISVRSDGEIYACVGEPVLPLNVKTHSFKDIYTKIKKLNYSTAVDKMERCNECELKYLCMGRCKSLNYKRTSSFLKVECNQSFKKACRKFLFYKRKKDLIRLGVYPPEKN